MHSSRLLTPPPLSFPDFDLVGAALRGAIRLALVLLFSDAGGGFGAFAAGGSFELREPDLLRSFASSFFFPTDVDFLRPLPDLDRLREPDLLDLFLDPLRDFRLDLERDLRRERDRDFCLDRDLRFDLDRDLRLRDLERLDERDLRLFLERESDLRPPRDLDRLALERDLLRERDRFLSRDRDLVRRRLRDLRPLDRDWLRLDRLLDLDRLLFDFDPDRFFLDAERSFLARFFDFERSRDAEDELERLRARIFFFFVERSLEAADPDFERPFCSSLLFFFLLSAAWSPDKPALSGRSTLVDPLRRSFDLSRPIFNLKFKKIILLI